MDDDENDNQDQDEENDAEENSKSTYSKKKHFGKLDKDFRAWVLLQVTYRPRNDFWKPFSISIDSGKLAITHKKQFDDLKSTTKLKLNVKYDSPPRFNELTSKINKKIAGSTLAFTNKIDNNQNISSKISHSFNLWENLKIKYGLDVEKKNDWAFGTNLGINYKRSFIGIPFLPFITSVAKYNQTFRIGTNLKTGKQTKYDAQYNSHITTRDNHRVYFSHKLIYDPNTRNPSPISQVLTINAQDGDSIATVNTSINLEKFTIKSKEVRFLIEYEKKYRFGVQKRNDIYEFLVQRYKINQRFLKSVRFSIGNKGFLTALQGKFSPWKGNVDYTLNLKIKPGGGNFYDDFSSCLNLKWNI